MGRSLFPMAGRKKEPPRYSQFDEEPILRGLLKGKPAGKCCEFGAREKRGSNVAWLVDENWPAVLIDVNVNRLHADYAGCKHVTIIQACVTPQNVNELVPRDVTVLSIDIDGNDYWVWKALKWTPDIVVIETNPRMTEGVQPYKEGLCKGCSVETMLDLGAHKGYRLHEKTGVNLIFVR